MTTDNTPTFMNDPTNNETLYNAIYLQWDPISSAADTGGDPVSYYYVNFYNRPCYSADASDCTVEDPTLGSWTEVSSKATQGASTSFVHTCATHFHPASNYEYRICAINGVGFGACSNSILVLTDDIP